jgi:hypothetical protein
MSEHGAPEWAIPRDEIAELAALFDRFEYAFDPTFIAAKEAESKFEDRVLQLFRERGHPNFADVNSSLFHSKLRTLCRLYFRKNP